MKFDLEKMFEETRRTAKEYSEQITGLCKISLIRSGMRRLMTELNLATLFVNLCVHSLWSAKNHAV